MKKSKKAKKIQKNDQSPKLLKKQTKTTESNESSLPYNSTKNHNKLVIYKSICDIELQENIKKINSGKNFQEKKRIKNILTKLMK